MVFFYIEKRLKKMEKKQVVKKTITPTNDSESLYPTDWYGNSVTAKKEGEKWFVYVTPIFRLAKDGFLHHINSTAAGFDTKDLAINGWKLHLAGGVRHLLNYKSKSEPFVEQKLPTKP